METGAFGNEAYILTGYFNLPKILELTLYNGYDHVAGRQLGLPLGNAEDFHSYEELLDAYHKQIEYFLDIKIRGSNLIESIYANYMPVPFLSVITNDCIATGKDYNAGGARYNTSYLQGVGIGTVTDSLAAIRFQVFDGKNITMRDLLRAMREDFANDPQILNLVQTTARNTATTTITPTTSCAACLSFTATPSRAARTSAAALTASTCSPRRATSISARSCSRARTAAALGNR